MRKYAPIVIVLVLLLALTGVVAWVVQSDSESVDDLLVDLGLRDADGEEISGSGFIEVEQVTVSSELGGRITSVWPGEGDKVVRGDPLVDFDAEQVAAQVRQAEAGVAAAWAQVDRLTVGGRPEEIRQAEAGLEQAEAARDGAEQAWRDAVAIRDDPQQIELQIQAAETAVDVGERRLETARANLEAAAEARDQARSTLDAASAGLAAGQASAADVQQARAQFEQIEDQWLQAWLAADTVEVELEGARLKLASLRALRSKPIDLEARVDAARARYDGAVAAVSGAEAQLALLRAGASEEQRRQAEAGLRQAEARLRLLQVQSGKMSVQAPMDGTVIEVLARAGENVLAGVPLVRLADLDPLRLTIFVAETDVGEVEPGQAVEVTVDAYEDETFEGEVAAIASEAEFTPKNVQTADERASLVFAVEIRLPNEDGRLKPGMPADATIMVDGES